MRTRRRPTLPFDPGPPGEFATLRVMQLVVEHGRRRPFGGSLHFDLDSALVAARRLARSVHRGHYAVWIEHVDAPATLRGADAVAPSPDGRCPRGVGR